MNLLFVDIPTYPVTLPGAYRALLSRRLQAGAEIRRLQLGYQPHRPALTYSRGLLTVASSLARSRHQVKYVVYTDEQDRRRLADLFLEADILALTAVTPTVGTCASVSEFAKRVNPRIKAVIGGSHVEAVPIETLEAYPTFDFAITGAGEVALPLLLQRLNSPDRVPDAVYRDDVSRAVLRSTARSTAHPQVNITPSYDLLYRAAGEYAHNVQTQSGCPYCCEFCREHKTFTAQGVRSTESVVSEIDFLSQSCAPGTLIHFSDSNFTMNKNRCLELCGALAGLRHQLCFSVDSRPDLIDADLVEAMSRAGVVLIRLGFEDREESILQDVQKGISPSRAVQAAGVIRETNPSLIVHAYWITGTPGATRASIFSNADTIHDLVTRGVVDEIGNKVLVPYPGTRYYDNGQEYGLQLLTRDWNLYDRLSFPVFRTDNLSEFEIYHGFQFLESVLLEAYRARLGSQWAADSAGLDYVYASYVSQDRSRA